MRNSQLLKPNDGSAKDGKGLSGRFDRRRNRVSSLASNPSSRRTIAISAKPFGIRSFQSQLALQRCYRLMRIASFQRVVEQRSPAPCRKSTKTYCE